MVPALGTRMTCDDGFIYDCVNTSDSFAGAAGLIMMREMLELQDALASIGANSIERWLGDAERDLFAERSTC
jgi:hypothetical protein